MLKNKSTLIKLGVLGVVIALAVAGVFSVRSSANSNAQTEEVFLRTQILTRESLEETVTGTGSVAASESAAVYSTVSNGKISQILVSTSDYVTEGETMFILDMETLNEEILEKEEDIEERTATLQSTFNEAKEDANEAYTTVYGSGGTKEVYDSALAEYNKVVSAISYLQTDYDTAYSLNQEALITLNNAQSELAELKATVPSDPGDTFTLAEPTDTTLENFDELKAEWDAAKEKYEADKLAYDTAKTNYDANSPALTDAISDAQAHQAITLADLTAKQTALSDAKTAIDYDTIEKKYTDAKQSYDTTLNAYNTALEKQITADDAMYNDASLLADNEQLENLYNDREDYYIKAEISGQVTEINTEVGSIVTQNSALAKIQDTSSLELEIDIPESDINKIKVGQSAIISTDAFEEELGGVVVEISPTATSTGMGSTSSTFTVKIEVKDAISSLLVGMNAQADIIVASEESEFVVPLSAVETEAGVSSIYIQTGEELIEENFTKIAVTLLENDGYYTQISSSELQEGMEVVTTLNVETVTVEMSEEMEGMMMPGMTSGMTGGSAPGGTTGGGTTGGAPAGGGRG